MKIVCQKADILKSVNIVMKAVPSKTTMPILGCIMMDASRGEIKFTTNDMELGIETIVKGSILEKGKVALDAKLFSEIVRKLPDSDVTISTDDNYQATITCEKSRFSISGKEGEDYPYIPFVEKDNSICISQFTLREVIKQTIFSIAQNENNKMMTGELFEVNDNVLKVVALDGHRISIRKIELKDSYEHKKVVVPGKTLIEISKILSGETEDMINIFFTKNHIMFEMEDTIAVSRLIEGEYFHIEQMISNDYETKVQINKRELLECIDRAILLISENDKKPLIIGIDDTTMELKVTAQSGSMNEQINVHKEGKDILIGFNPRFMMDALRVINDETINIYLVNPKAPCFIRDDQETYTYLILPVNFNQ